MWLTDLCRVVSVVFVLAAVMPTVNAATTLDWEFYPASYRARLRQYYSALKVWKPAVDSYDDLEKIQRGLATKQLQHAQITPEEKEAKIKAVDLYISNMRSYREAMRLYKTWLLQHHDINKSSYAWSDFVLAEWKDSQLGFRLPEKPPRIDRTDLEERQWNAHLKTFEVKRASCIKQHCQILHAGLCSAISDGVWEGEEENFQYLPAPFAP